MSATAIISEIYQDVRVFSFKEKKKLNEENINNFLDAINEFKKILKEETAKIDSFSDKFETVSWIDEDITEEDLMVINDIIAISNELHRLFIRKYIYINNAIKKKDIAKYEINDFKRALDDFKESYSDLESIFFVLPFLPEFKETTKIL